MNTRICGKQADRFYSRGFGRRAGNCVDLSWIELAYLCEKKMLDCDFRSVVREASSQVGGFDIFYLAYRDLRNRGYVLKVEGEHFVGRKNYSMNFYPLSDMDSFHVHDFLDVTYPFMLAIVDSDGEVTYYMVEKVNPEGTHRELPSSVELELYGKRAFIFSQAEALEKLTYGRNEGEWGHLSVLEAMYLWEKGINSKKPRVRENIYEVYRYLREHGLIVKSGFKYGTHFRVYENSMEEHSKYLVHVISSSEELQKISRGVRVAHGVRKSLLLAYVSDGPIFFKLSWVRP